MSIWDESDDLSAESGADYLREVRDRFVGASRAVSLAMAEWPPRESVTGWARHEALDALRAMGD